jgi:hypothetical protein
MDTLAEIGWPAILAHDRQSASCCAAGCRPYRVCVSSDRSWAPIPCLSRPSRWRACHVPSWRHGSRQRKASGCGTAVSVPVPT